MTLPTIHLIAPFHTQLNSRTSSCAFSMKSLRFSKMMHLLPEPYRVVEYSNAGSTSEADEKVVMLTQEEFDHHYPAQKPEEFHGNYATIADRGWPQFNARLIQGLLDRVKPGDIIGHQFGRAHQGIVPLFPNNPHAELGVGYPDKPFGAFRIFESEIWRAYHWGRDDENPLLRNDRGMSRAYSWVVPNYFDLEDWPFCPAEQNEDYVLYMGRITPEKGMQTLVEIIRENALMVKEGVAEQLKFVFAGQGNFDELIARQIVRSPNPFIAGLEPKVEFRGPVYGRDRAALVGKARCMVMPTQFTEPFGGAGVEGMLTGTPLVSVNYGAFVETVRHGETGYRCNTLGDWLTAIEATKHFQRDWIHLVTRDRYSLQACARLYDAAFRQISDLSGKGWYERKSRHIPAAVSRVTDQPAKE